jgi:hypothetical protein
MKTTPTGTFTPLHGVNPDPSEGDWRAPEDLPSEEDIERARLLVTHMGERSSMHKTSHDCNAQKSSVSGVENNYSDLSVSRSSRVGPSLQSVVSDLESEIIKLNAEGANLFSLSQYDEAAQKAEAGKVFRTFLQKVKNIHDEWQEISKLSTPPAASRRPSNPAPSKSARTRSPRKFSVILDGDDVSGQWGGEVFANSIFIMGIDKVKELEIIRYGEPLISDHPSEKYSSICIDGLYIMTHFNAKDKRTILSSIAKSLGHTINIDIIK